MERNKLFPKRALIAPSALGMEFTASDRLEFACALKCTTGYRGSLSGAEIFRNKRKIIILN